MASVNMVPVSSSNIAAVGYDVDEKLLQVQFHNGRTYQYLNVPHSVAQGLLDASSVGQYFSACIHNDFMYLET